MEIQIQTHTANDLSRLKAIAYSALGNNELGQWSYSKFGMEEHALCTTVEVEGCPTLITFLIEVNASLIVLTPAHIKGEKSIPPKVYLNCMCDIIRFLLNTNVLTSIKTITISKQLSR